MRPIILCNMYRFCKTNLMQSTCPLELFVFKSIKLNNSTNLGFPKDYNRTFAVWNPRGIPRFLAVGCNFTFWRCWNLKLRRLTAVSHHETVVSSCPDMRNWGPHLQPRSIMPNLISDIPALFQSWNFVASSCPEENPLSNRVTLACITTIRVSSPTKFPLYPF